MHNNGWDRGLNPKALQNTRLKSCLLVEVDEPALKWPFDLCTKERPITCKVGKKPAAGTRGRLEKCLQEKGKSYTQSNMEFVLSGDAG